MFHPNGPSFVELARQALSSTERGYDLLAPKFDFTPFRTPPGVLRALEELVRAELEPKRVLDLCCGTGAVADALPGLDIVGLDKSMGMLRHGGQRPDSGALVRADALHPPFRASFDLVTCFGALGHFLPEESAALVDAVDSCLAPGGHFVFVTAQDTGVASLRFWLSHGFDVVMTLRNFLWSPPFVMFYRKLDFARLASELQERGFECRALDIGSGLVIVDAVKFGCGR